MKIVSLTLSKYKRFNLNGINKIVFTPKQRSNLILGANGSGKSSLLKELSPLPANSNKDFNEGGYKDITIEFHNSIYRLTSGMLGSTKHQFIKDGEELNDGHTKKIQLQLVKEHFNVTPELQEVFLGHKRFTKMSPAERKKYFTNISTVDYTYAINLFNKTKIRHRDLIGGIKILNHKLSTVKSKIISDEEHQILLKQDRIYKDIITSSLTALSNVDVTALNISTLETETDILSKFYKNFTAMNLITDETEESVKTKLYIIENEITTLIKEIDVTSIKTEVEHLDSNSLKLTLSSLEKEISDITTTMYVDLSIKDISFTQSYLVSILVKSYDLIDSIVSSKVSVDMSVVSSLKLKLDTLKERERTLSRFIHTLNEDKTIIEANKDKDTITCGNCGSSWKEGYDAVTHKLILDKLKNHNDSYEVNVKEILSLEKELSETQSKINDISLFKQLFNNQELKKILYYLLSDLNISTDGEVVKQRLFKIKESLALWVKLTTLNLELENNKNKLLLILKTEDQINNIQLLNKEELELKINRAYNNRDRYRLLLKQLKDNVVMKQKLKESSERLIGLIKQFTINNKKIITIKRNESLKNIIEYCKKASDELSLTLNNILYNEKLRDSLTIEIIELEQREVILKNMVNSLSPNSGLIAKSINAFLGVFITDINKLINKIWTYPLNVLPCSIENGDLDYKFNLSVDGEDSDDDISKGSTGQREIIDTCFKLVSMQYLNMLDYPLMLDEFAASFDIEHRERAMKITETLSTMSNFSQMFTVSHFPEAFIKNSNNVDTVVLSEDNILTTDLKSYNKNIKIT